MSYDVTLASCLPSKPDMGRPVQKTSRLTLAVMRTDWSWAASVVFAFFGSDSWSYGMAQHCQVARRTVSKNRGICMLDCRWGLLGILTRYKRSRESSLGVTYLVCVSKVRAGWRHAFVLRGSLSSHFKHIKAVFVIPPTMMPDTDSSSSLLY